MVDRILVIILWFGVCAIALAVSGLILEIRDTVISIIESP